jgi:hypothetical protein
MTSLIYSIGGWLLSPSSQVAFKEEVHMLQTYHVINLVLKLEMVCAAHVMETIGGKREEEGTHLPEKAAMKAARFGLMMLFSSVLAAGMTYYSGHALSFSQAAKLAGRDIVISGILYGGCKLLYQIYKHYTQEAEGFYSSLL